MRFDTRSSQIQFKSIEEFVSFAQLLAGNKIVYYEPTNGVMEGRMNNRFFLAKVRPFDAEISHVRSMLHIRDFGFMPEKTFYVQLQSQ